jgi:EAL domain-containing protein (putative c-di-GMP-specific phosphodiesterase class I)/GGDEF domain-containing protein
LNQSVGKMIQSFLDPKGMKKLVALMFIFILLVLSNLLVYTMGGTKLAYVHGFYIPIIVSGIIFSVPGGLITALLASLLSGPIMPFDVALEIAQPSESWMLRSIFFFLVGGLSGTGAKMVKAYLRDLENRLITDSVTQLLNSRGLMEEWDQNFIPKLKTNPAIVIIRIHELSSIEAILSPAEVAQLFNKVAQVLNSVVKDLGVIAALEAGTFALLLYEGKKVKETVARCRADLGNVFTINDIPVFVNIFYGIAEVHKKEESIIALLHRGRIAAEKAIRNNVEVTFFESEDETQLLRNAKIIHDLSEAISSNELKLFYQPQIRLETGQVERLEALVRWPHSELGMVSPGEFIPLAEGTLLINPFTQWLLDQALSQLIVWLEKGFDLCLSINFSMKNFYDPAIFELIYKTLQKYGVPPQKLEIEITETAFATNLSQVAGVLHTLRETGVRIAIDDFGTGQASLHYLLELPIDILKIDQVFTRNMLKNSGAEAIVRSAILLGHELNLEVVAEGVQNEDEYRRLIDLKCDYGQGFYFSEPMPADPTSFWLLKKLT